VWDRGKRLILGASYAGPDSLPVRASAIYVLMLLSYHYNFKVFTSSATDTPTGLGAVFENNK